MSTSPLAWSTSTAPELSLSESDDAQRGCIDLSYTTRRPSLWNTAKFPCPPVSERHRTFPNSSMMTRSPLCSISLVRLVCTTSPRRQILGAWTVSVVHCGVVLVVVAVVRFTAAGVVVLGGGGGSVVVATAGPAGLEPRSTTVSSGDGPCGNISAPTVSVRTETTPTATR